MKSQPKKPEKEVALRVGEIPANAQGDIGLGIVRIDYKIMQKLGIKEGDPVEIEGERKTVAVALRPYPSDVGLEIIRMDGYTRRNAGTSIGEKVIVRKAQVKEAKHVTLAPAEQGMMIKIPGDHLRRLLKGRYLTRGDIIIPGTASRRRQEIPALMGFEELFGGFGFGEIRLVVVSTNPSDSPVVVTDRTEVKLLPKPQPVTEEKMVGPSVTYEDIGGLHEEVKKVREMIELPLKHPELFKRLGIEPPKGVLLYGPPGTGKTLLAKAVASESGAHFISIKGPEIMSKYYGESEQNIRKVFEEAQQNTPSIIFIDEVDSIAPKREDSGEVERRVVSQLLTLMDGLEARGEVIVIAATNRPDDIDPALRRPGRFDREIEIGVPNRDARKEILQIHTRNMPLDKSVDLDWLANVTHGYVGADLEALCKEAAMAALRRVLPEIDMTEEEIPMETLEKLVVTREDFNTALLTVQPSALREVMIEIPNVKWEDIGGLDEAKQYLKEMVEWPLKHPEAFKRMGIKPPKGILLYGLPGTGKTLLAKAVASESEANFISIKGPEIFNKYVGESEKAIREIFKKARQVSPSIVFIDEIDSIAPERSAGLDSGVTERVVNQILAEMDGLESLEGVVVIAATNRPDMIDTALLRPGRFDRHVYVPVPDDATRKKIFEVHTRNMPLDKDVDLDWLVEKTRGYVGADIEAICREAAITALRRDINAKKVTKRDFEEALKKVKRTVTDEDIREFEKRVKQTLLQAPVAKELSYLG